MVLYWWLICNLLYTLPQDARRAVIDCTEQIIDNFSNHLSPEIVEEIIHRVDWENFTHLSIEIYHQLSQNNNLLSYFMSFHAQENERVEDELSAMLARGH